MNHDASEAADPARLAIIWQVLRQRWRLLIVIGLLGALVGGGASLVYSPGYETSASVLLQGPRDPDELLTEAQVAKSSVVLDRAAGALRWGVSGVDLVDDVGAAVAEGNIIDITAMADTPERAQQLADRVAQEYVTFSSQLTSNTTDASAQVSQEQQQTLRRQIIDTNKKISELHTAAGDGETIDSVGVRTELESLRTALSQAVSKLDELGTSSGSAKMVVMGPAERPKGPAAPTMAHFVAGGAALFLLIGLFGHLYAARADKRLRDEAQITAALGTTGLGTLEVPDEPSAAAAEQAPKSLARRLAGLVVADGQWHVPEPSAAPDEDGLAIRYRRTVARLREQLPPGPGRVLAVVCADDPAAGRAVARLDEFTGPARIAVRVAEVDAERPTVPDDAVAGVLVVVTSGTRTGWELVRVAEACGDAGHDVLGVIVTHRTRPADDDTRPGDREEPALAGAR